jgi:hypothetical protein
MYRPVRQPSRSQPSSRLVRGGVTRKLLRFLQLGRHRVARLKAILGTEARQLGARGSVVVVVSAGFPLREMPPTGSRFPRARQGLLPHTRLQQDHAANVEPADQIRGVAAGFVPDEQSKPGERVAQRSQGFRPLVRRPQAVPEIAEGLGELGGVGSGFVLDEPPEQGHGFLQRGDGLPRVADVQQVACGCPKTSRSDADLALYG